MPTVSTSYYAIRTRRKFRIPNAKMSAVEQAFRVHFFPRCFQFSIRLRSPHRLHYVKAVLLFPLPARVQRALFCPIVLQRAPLKGSNVVMFGASWIVAYISFSAPSLVLRDLPPSKYAAEKALLSLSTYFRNLHDRSS